MQAVRNNNSSNHPVQEVVVIFVAFIILILATIAGIFKILFSTLTGKENQASDYHDVLGDD